MEGLLLQERQIIITLSMRAVSHFSALSPRLGTMATPFALFAERYSLMAKHLVVVHYSGKSVTSDC